MCGGIFNDDYFKFTAQSQCEFFFNENLLIIWRIYEP